MRHAVRALILLAVGPDYGERYIPADAAAAQRSARGTIEASCEVRRAPGDKGMGVFAAEPIEPGRWVCRYMGEVVATSASQAAPLFDPLGLISVSTAGLREVEPSSDYLLELTPGLCIDGRHSEHFSRFVNHDEHGQPHPLTLRHVHVTRPSGARPWPAMLASLTTAWSWHPQATSSCA